VNTIIYRLGRVVIVFIQCLPLRLVARMGRIGGGLIFYLDGRHRKVAVNNLTKCFGREKSSGEIKALALENFRRIGENYVCAVKTAGMSFAQLQPHLAFDGFDRFPQRRADGVTPSIVTAVGHFGNFELYARIQDVRPDLQGATTYRALKQPGINRLMQSLRGVNRCRFFERRTESGGLRQLMSRGNAIVGLLVDQSSAGMRAPFLGHDCHTNLAAAVFALRYECELFPVICHRVGLAQWRLAVGERIQTHREGTARSSQDIMGDVNLALEAAVQRDPANWFWVHRRWKN
jgi:KDO2-lipid IV(A) lauroyltransferase